MFHEHFCQIVAALWLVFTLKLVFPVKKLKRDVLASFLQGTRERTVIIQVHLLIPKSVRLCLNMINLALLCGEYRHRSILKAHNHEEALWLNFDLDHIAFSLLIEFEKGGNWLIVHDHLSLRLRLLRVRSLGTKRTGGRLDWRQRAHEASFLFL